MSALGRAERIPGGSRVCDKCRVVCCDGTWVAPSASYVQAIGAWKESEMARDPGARCVGYRRAASNGADCEAGLKAPTLSAQNAHAAVFPGQGGEARSDGRKIAERGCRKATLGAVRPLEPFAGGSRGGSSRASWGGSSAPRLPSRHPRTRRTPRLPRGTDGACAKRAPQRDLTTLGTLLNGSAQ
jgi:hypothetical protein